MNQKVLASPLKWFLLLILFFVSTFSFIHHWDEYFYLYSTDLFSLSELLELEPELQGGLFPTGFFSTKIGFVAVLELLNELPLQGILFLRTVQFIFALIVPLIAYFSYLVLKEIYEERIAKIAAVIFLFTPLSAYFSFKVLTEYYSLLPTVIGSLFYILSFRQKKKSNYILFLLLTSLFVAFGLVSRFTSVGFFLVLAGSLFLVGFESFPRLKVLLSSAGCFLFTLILSAFIFKQFAGISFFEMMGSVKAVTGRDQGVALKIYSFFMILQFFAPLVLLGMMRFRQKEVLFAIIWFVVSVFPFLLFGNYIEPRYLYLAGVPLALLVYYGFVQILSFVPVLKKYSNGFLGAIAVTVLFLGDQILFSKLMPYEHDEQKYNGLIASVYEEASDAHFLLPWVSDYCLLKLSYPNSPISLCWSMRDDISASFFEKPEFLKWVGAGGYVPDQGALSQISSPVYYLGWKYNQPALEIKKRMMFLKNEYIDSVEAHEGLKNHLEKTWLWNHSTIKLVPHIQNYHYESFLLEI